MSSHASAHRSLLAIPVACLSALLALSILPSLPAAQQPTTVFTPSSVPWDTIIDVTNSPSTGGSVDFDVTITPTQDLPKIAITLVDEGIMSLSSNLDTEQIGLAAGVPLVISGSASLSGTGIGRLFAQVELFETTDCGDLPVIAQEAQLIVIDDGALVVFGSSSSTEVELDHINALLDAGTITQAEADVLAEDLARAEGVTSESVVEAPSEAPGSGVNANVFINGTAQWTDSAGGLHPSRQVVVKIFTSSAEGNLTEVASGLTQAGNGSFSFSLVPSLLGPSPRDLVAVVLAENFATRVHTPTVGSTAGHTYFLFRLFPSVADGTTLSGQTFTANNTSQADKAWSIADAMITGNEYIQAVNGTTLPKISTVYPRAGTGTASFYSSSSGTMNIHPSKPFAWDVLLHEYGHFIADQFNLDNSPGGAHACNENLISTKGKDPGARLAWSEGLATYLGIAAQAVTNATALAIPNVGDTSYHSVTTSGTAWQYDLEARDKCLATSEGSETNVGRCLWDLADSATDQDDLVALGHTTTWNTIKAMAAHNNLSDNWNQDISGKTTAEKILLGKIFAQNKVAPQATAPVDGASIPSVPPTFKWKKNGLIEFTVRFFDGSNVEIGNSGTLGNVPFWKPTQSEWDAIRNATSDTLLWLVEGSETQTPKTGDYWGNCRRMGGVDFAFVIDTTGSMGEEIDGVRTALLAFLAGFNPLSTDIQFQLTVFKDSASVFAPTSDLATIQGQVSSLSASGGGDCPEDSVGGLSQGTLAIKNGGTVMFATDADPRPGSDLGALIAQLTTSGARVNVLLSGTCFGTLHEPQTYGGSAVVDQWDGTPPLPDNGSAASPWLGSGNDLTGGGGRQVGWGSPLGGSPANLEGGGFTGAVDAYTQIAQATGGTFAFVPEVNSFGSGSTEYENTANNILAAAIEPRVVLATPSSLAQGSSGTLTIKGQNTTFLGTTAVSFGDGISVDQVEVLDPVTLAVTVSVDPAAATGFRDATASTQLSPSEVEQAFGLGVLEIVADNLLPELLTASPAVVAPGDATDVHLTAHNTTWSQVDPASIAVSFGSGITIGAISVLSDTELDVSIGVDPGAFLGFRTTSVTSSSETAFNAAPDTFRVSELSAALPLVQSVVPAQASPDSTLDLLIGVSGVQVSPDETTLEFTGTGIVVNSVTGCGSELMANVTIAADAPTGARDVIVRSGGISVTGVNGFVVVAPKEHLFAPRVAWKLNWASHAKGKPADSLKLSGVIGRAGLDKSAEMISFTLEVNGVTVLGPLALKRGKKGWAAKQAGAKVALSAVTGGYGVSLKGADLRPAFPDLSSADNGKSTADVSFKASFGSSGLETPSISNTLRMDTKAKAGKSEQGSFSFARDESLSGVFGVLKAKAKQAKGGGHSLTLGGPLVPAGGAGLGLDVANCSEVTITLGSAAPIVLSACDFKQGGKPGKEIWAVSDKAQGLKAFGWSNAKKLFALKTLPLALGLPLAGEPGTEQTLQVSIQLTAADQSTQNFSASVPMTRGSTKSKSWKH